jgi:hypothetical protein
MREQLIRRGRENRATFEHVAIRRAPMIPKPSKSEQFAIPHLKAERLFCFAGSLAE